MKKMILLGIIISSFIAYSQDILSPPPIEEVATSSTINRGSPGFIRGWNWGDAGGARLDTAMYINFYHLNINAGDRYPHHINTATPVPNVAGGGRNNDWILTAQSLHLEPTLAVDSVDETFKPRGSDNTGAVFGWYYRNLIVGDTNGTDNDLSKFQLLQSNKQYLVDTIFKSAWNGSILHWLDYDGNHHSTMQYIGITNDTNEIQNDETRANDKAVYHPFNGKQFYLSINIKANDFTDINNHLNDTILVIKIPYILSHKNDTTHNYGYVKFDSIPYLTSIHNDRFISTIGNEFRGVYRKLDTSTIRQPENFAILGSMLKNLDWLSQDTSITLSAFAFFDGETIPLIGGYRNNPLFIYDWYENRYDIQEFISKIDVEVYYYGNLDCKIDWIRLETPRFRNLITGSLDSIIRFNVVAKIDEATNHDDSLRISRFYCMDELTPPYWHANRYYNLLVDTLGVLETFTYRTEGTGYLNSPVHYLHATGFKEYWNGSNLCFLTEQANPYIRRSHQNIGQWPDLSCFSSISGYNGNNLFQLNDTINSNYETFLHGYFTSLPINDSLLYEYKYGILYGGVSKFNSRWSTQFYIEDCLYHSYYKTPTLLFNIKPWWANLWIICDFDFFPALNSFSIQPNCQRQSTGEEVRLAINSPLMLGAKGFIYWFKTTNPNMFENQKFLGLQPQNLNYGNLFGDDLIYSNNLGADYIDYNNDPNGFDDFYNNVYDWQSMQIDSSRIYLSLKSVRAEITKANKYISTVEEELLNKRLVSWYAKGFIQWRTTDPDFTHNILDDYIDTSGIKTRPIGRMESGSPLYEQHSNIDSGFYDISLMRDSDDNLDSMKKNFTLCVLNRRTDPLIVAHDTLDKDQQIDSVDTKMKFYTTAEFDTCVQRGGNTINNIYHDTTWWRDKWWRKQGCREIVIPFKYLSNDANEYCLIRVRELGGDLYHKDPDKFWWRDTKYYHYVDTTIGQDKNLVIRLLPGEGKMLKIDVLPPPENIVGDLKYSNQRKLIAYPLRNSQGVDNRDSICYHMTFHKKVNDTLRVFYARSKPVHKDSLPLNENIIWNDVICVSNQIYTGLCNETGLYCTECGYPSIVVRPDANGNHIAFIVFACLYNNQTLIEETFFEAEQANLSIPIPRMKTTVTGHSLADWGTPMVNASSLGNFYTWSDSLFGIGIGWKSALNNCFQYKVYKRWDNNFQQHPSLNSFSRLFNSENECGLVWESNYYNQNPPTCNSQKNICYAQVYFNTQNQLTLKKLHLVNSDPVLISNDSTMVNITYNSELCRYPVIYRGIESDSSKQYDRISFEKYCNSGEFPTAIYCNGSQQGTRTDLQYLPIHTVWDSTIAKWNTRVYPISSIYSPNINLLNPDLSQGEDLGDGENASPRAIISEFNTYDICDTSSNHGQKIWHFPHSYSSFISQTSINIGNLTDAGMILGNGYLPHIAARPKVFINEWWKNRRVFEQTDTMPFNNKVLTSAQYFYKTRYEMKAVPFIGFNGINSHSFISPFWINYGQLEYDLTFLESDGCDTCPRNNFGRSVPEVIKTKWFKISDIKNLDFMVKGMDNERSELILERKDNGNRFRLMIPSLSDSLTNQLAFKLINGGNREYRLLFQRRNTNVRYTENISLMPEPYSDMMPKSSEEETIVDLGILDNHENSVSINLSIYPNPADELIYITAYLPGIKLSQRMNISVYSLLGFELFKKEVKAGETISVPTENYPIGMYYIRAEQVISGDEESYLPAKAEPFVIKR